MKVTLIEPAMIKTEQFSEKPSWVLAPLTLATLAGLTPPEVEVEALDDRIEEIDYDAPRDLVGISVKTFTARRAYQIAAEFRRRGVPVILGGHHPTLIPEEAQQYADSILVGEAEGIWDVVIADAQRNKLKPRYKRETDFAFENVCVDRSVFAGKKYLPIALVETTRGCPFACNFCSVTTFFGRGFRHRPPHEVVREIEQLGKTSVFLVDDNIVADKAAAKELFRALIPLNIRWISQASLTMTKDLELMRLMRESGCAGVLVGIETIDPANLKQIRKSWNTVGIGYPAALQVARDHGIAVVGSFILGMDGDTPESLESLLEFAIRERFFAALFNILTPYPGTDLYQLYLERGRLIRPRWWLDPDYTYGSVVFEPNGISAIELAHIRLKLYRRFYGLSSMAYRMLDPLANLRDPWHALTFLSMNLPAHKEEAMRFGQALGAD
ncbi:MAG: B12-binding domain-containing radical SAM protein [Anaerolineae bacterium]|nr:MAG: B12-binding domain-containing radical SAM protein [Anaerolineae bacterium]